MIIEEANVKIIPDSRKDPTLEVTLRSGKYKVTASVPSGKSTGANEVFVLEPKEVIKKFKDLVRSQILNHNFLGLEQFDNFLISLDGTINKSNLGANLILSLSIGFVKLSAATQDLEPYELIAHIAGQKITYFPWGFYNLIEGGVHAKDSLPFQEYLFVPQADSPKDSLDLVNNFIKLLGIEIEGRYGKLRQGDEGGFCVPSDDPGEGLRLLQRIREMTQQEGSGISMDIAASALYEDGMYKVGLEKLTRDQMLSLYKDWEKEFKLFSIEDPFDQTDWEGFEKITRDLGNKVLIIADDLTTTNPEQVKIAGDRKAANAMIIKPNQIGSVSETIKAALLAKKYSWKIIVSHRSGETMDPFIADLAVGLQAEGLKSGCPLQKERLVKYERLAEIEKQLVNG